MSGEQFWKLLVDYGPVVAVLSFLVLGGIFLILLYKPLSKFFRAVDTILGIPARLDTQDAEAKTKKEALDALGSAVKDQGEKLDRHISDAKKQTDDWAQNMQPKIDELIFNSKIAAHEMQHNGGSSIKDDVKVLKEQQAAIQALLFGSPYITGKIPIKPARLPE